MQWNWKFYAMSLAVYWDLLETWVEQTRLASDLSIRVFQTQLRFFLRRECSLPFSKDSRFLYLWKGISSSIKNKGCYMQFLYHFLLLMTLEPLSERRVLCENESALNGFGTLWIMHNTLALIHNILSLPVQWQVNHTPSAFLWKFYCANKLWAFGFLPTHCPLIYLILVILFLT